MAENIGNFYIQIAKNARTAPVKQVTDILNKNLENTNFGKFVNFLGVGSTNAVNSSIFDNVFALGPMYVVNPTEDLQKLLNINRQSNGNFNSFLGKEQVKTLKKIGVDVSSRFGKETPVKSSIYLNSLAIEKGNIPSSLKTIYHEIGHSASLASGARAESKSMSAKALSILNDTESVLTFGKISDLSVDILRGDALEEGRAEQFAFETLNRRFADSAAMGKSINIKQFMDQVQLAYLTPASWKNYLSSHTTSIESALRRMEGFDEAALPELMKDIGTRIKATSVGIMHGHFQLISGDLQSEVARKSDSIIEQQVAGILNYDRRNQVMSIIEKESNMIKESGRRVVLGDQIAGAIDNIDASGQRLIAASVSDNISQVLQEATQTKSLLHAATEASTAVASGASGSKMLRTAGAALSILRKRI